MIHSQVVPKYYFMQRTIQYAIFLLPPPPLPRAITKLYIDTMCAKMKGLWCFYSKAKKETKTLFFIPDATILK
jgi:hypothetical protein